MQAAAVMAPRIEVELTWPKPLPKDMPPLPTFQPRVLKFDCKAS